MAHYLKDQLEPLIEELEINDLQKKFIKSRWLDQLVWLDKKASQSQKKHFRLRLITIIGGVIIPAMVSFNLRDGKAKEVLFWSTFALTQVVAISAAVEEFFHYGEKWTQYRKTAESMKTEGWQFFQLSGPYRESKTHAGAYRSFADRVEHLIQEDVSAITEVVQDKQSEEEREKLYAMASSIGAQYQPSMHQPSVPSPGSPMPPPPRPRHFDSPPGAPILLENETEPTVPRYTTAPVEPLDLSNLDDTDTPAISPITSSPPREAEVTSSSEDKLDPSKLLKPPGAPITPRGE
ncbi:MAG: DUF4231 domain-containing protein [Cyanobacteria bacterium SID2]|nr:DUF4231 domain-containing protein [Cyanobacteria bacterium SID2]MBP0005105.1 DUF4231 domain-containing protein [Cyanobacteria bacterium SBC]